MGTSFRAHLPPLAVITFFAVMLGVGVFSAATRPGVDFEVFLRAGQRLVQGESLYQIERDGFFLYKYFPVTAAVFVPFAVAFEPLGPLPNIYLVEPRGDTSGARSLAFGAWNVLMALAFADAMRRVLRWNLTPTTWRSGVMVAVLTLTAWDLHFAFGQVDIGLLWLLVLGEDIRRQGATHQATALVQAKREWWLVAPWWSLACLFKPPVVLIFVLQAARHRWNVVIAGVTWIAGWLLLPMLWLGLSGWHAELEGFFAVHQASTVALWPAKTNQGLLGIVAHASSVDFGPVPADSPVIVDAWFSSTKGTIALVYVLGGAVFGIAAWASVIRVARRHPVIAETYGFALALALSAFLSPLAWRAGYVHWLPLWLCLLAWPTTQWGRTRRMVLWLAALLPLMVSHTVLRLLDKPRYGMWWDVVQFASFWALLYGAVLVVVLVLPWLRPAISRAGVLHDPVAAPAQPQRAAESHGDTF